jgi:hypothetical protein
VRRAALLGLAVVLALPATAAAYEFEVRARTIGQLANLAGARTRGSELLLHRRRFTQALALDVWDLGGGRRRLRPGQPDRRPGPRWSFVTYLRIDHEFGDYGAGTGVLGARRIDAIDLVPELEHGALQLDVLYAYLAAEELAGGALDLRIGRQLVFDPLDLVALDGVHARVGGDRLPVAGEAYAGLRVRERSPLAAAGFDLDGTSGGECEEYVEGATPGSGSWRPIDQRLDDDRAFRNDLDRCPQREAWMPVVGAAVETAGLPVVVGAAYRRAVSRTTERIGPADRFEHPDLGLYPDERGQAPRWGVNEEHATLSVRAVPFAAGPVALAPALAARYSLLHGVVEQVHASVPIRGGAQAIEPEVYYAFPTFDGDSIYNVFATAPYLDLRATWSLAPRASPLGGYVRGWARRFGLEDRQGVDDVERTRWAGGGQGGLRWRARGRTLARLDLFHEGGYGGRRTGAYARGELPLGRELELAARASVIDAASDVDGGLDATTVGVAGGATWRAADEIAVSLLLEEESSRLDRHQLRALAVLDLAFRPEL